MLIRLNLPPLNVEYDDVTFLLYNNGSAVEVMVRKAKDLYEVSYNKDFFKRKTEEKTVYYIYRALYRTKDKPLLESYKVRYDISIIPSGNLGEEYIKTAGHYHPISENGLTYPEIYEIIAGKAHYLLQQLHREKILDVVIVEAEKGDKILIPHGYGHVTINPSRETLIMANLVSSNFDSIYEPMKKKGGAAYFELTGGRFIKNKRYIDVPKIRVAKATASTRFPHNKNLYALFIESPEDFEFLNTPVEFEAPFSS